MPGTTLARTSVKQLNVHTTNRHLCKSNCLPQTLSGCDICKLANVLPVTIHQTLTPDTPSSPPSLRCLKKKAECCEGRNELLLSGNTKRVEYSLTYLLQISSTHLTDQRTSVPRDCAIFCLFPPPLREAQGSHATVTKDKC